MDEKIGADIATWWQRIGCMRNPGCFTGEEQARDAEIAELRAALASRATAGNAAPVEAIYFFRQKGTDHWIESEGDPRKSFADSPVRLYMEYRTLYASPAASNAATAAPCDLLRAVLDCYSPDDTIGDYQDKIRRVLASNAGTAP